MKTANLSGPGVGPWLVERLDAWGIEALTDIQVKCLAAGIADGHSLIVSAPTSSGKTLVGEIAVLKALRDNIRAIYLVSHKALADQKYLDFQSRFGEQAKEPLATVGLNTGDRAEGDIDARLMIATYEKALGLLLSGQLNPENALVVADEMQIVGEAGRGPEIETLCALLKQRKVKQFVALTATVENARDLAGWMECDLVRSTHRDVPLHQEIWYGGRAHRTTFGQTEGAEIASQAVPANDVISVVGQLLKLGKGPVLVFTESRREASNFATAFGQSRPRATVGIALAEQLDLFSEPTESSDQLKQNAERRVAFHSADLSPQERQVLEGGFAESKFEVCFATSTLGAGVNFPFRSIVFSKLTFEWGERAGSHLPLSDFRNMSGRAGRLGMHEDGYAILLPKNNVELTHANRLVQPENDRVSSRLVSISLRKTILALMASRAARSFDEVMQFFRNTLYWHQTLDRNPRLLETLEHESREAIKWLADNGFAQEAEGLCTVTPFGYASALSGLLPSTALQLLALLQKIKADLLADFENCVPSLIYAACACSEFRGERPPRFFPFVQASHDSVAFWSAKRLLVPLDRADVQLAQCAQAVMLFAEGMVERKISFATRVGSGQVHRLAIDISWVLDGLHKLACVPETDLPQTVSNNIAMLSRRVRWGAPAEALDVMRIAERHAVPGFGRQRAMALLAQGIATVHDLLSVAKDKLGQMLRSERRAEALIEAATNTAGWSPDRLAAAHKRVAQKLGIEKQLEACEREIGVAYEKAIVSLLAVETSWSITVWTMASDKMFRRCSSRSEILAFFSNVRPPQKLHH